MSQNVTTGQLLRWHDELKQLAQINSIFYHFNHSKIKEFYNKNGIRIDTAFKRMTELRKEFFLIENDQIVMEGEEGKKTPVLLPEKTKEDYDKKYLEIMNAEISIIL